MTYTPAIPADAWEETRRFVTAAVAACSGKTAYPDRDLLQATTRLAAWTLAQADIPLTRRVVFEPATIERFIAGGLPHYAPASRGNRRSMLLRMSEVLLGDMARRTKLAPLPASSASVPYTPDEVRELRTWVRLASGARRNNAMVLVALGLGAGLSAGEVVGVARKDIVREGRSVLVHVGGARPRTVAVDEAWAVDLLKAVQDAKPTDWVFCHGRVSAGKNLVTNFVAKTETRGLAPNSQRMRATWIVGHLNSGAGVVPLMRQAGVTSLEAITRYVQFVDEAA